MCRDIKSLVLERLCLVICHSARSVAQITGSIASMSGGSSAIWQLIGDSWARLGCSHLLFTSNLAPCRSQRKFEGLEGLNLKAHRLPQACFVLLSKDGGGLANRQASLYASRPPPVHPPRHAGRPIPSVVSRVQEVWAGSFHLPPDHLAANVERYPQPTRALSQLGIHKEWQAKAGNPKCWERAQSDQLMRECIVAGGVRKPRQQRG